MPLQIPADYGYTLLSAFIMALQYGLMGPWTMRHRIPMFNRDFMKGNFEEEHKNSGIRTPMWGYPDFGSGYYSKKLSYGDWLKFNCVLRCHINTLEYFPIAVLSMLTLGLFNPCLAATSGIAWVLSRFFYCWTYLNNLKRIEFASYVSLGIVVATSMMSLFKIYNHLSLK